MPGKCRFNINKQQKRIHLAIIHFQKAREKTIKRGEKLKTQMGKTQKWKTPQQELWVEGPDYESAGIRNRKRVEKKGKKVKEGKQRERKNLREIEKGRECRKQEPESRRTRMKMERKIGRKKSWCRRSEERKLNWILDIYRELLFPMV